ncbi:hypothetical protein AAW14_00925 [Streptomyces hygroscopicus]|uniref:hypothetical protein n=1 Tax=Streptomyces hygroscopicus TaxID=1912 RepID=UPI00223F0CC7|nr:hypothetical protein [Streptomyces hygroscopicus]MCW7940643.1 hypothetical protein [Streptomyces hygroscopicus]
MSSVTAFPPTGPSGVVGAALMPQLSRCHVVALIRRPPVPSAHGLPARDLTERRAGLEPFRTRLVAAAHGRYGDNALASALAGGGGQP